MAFKRALILGGAILLAAGCSSSVTAPIAKVDGGAASSTKAATNPPARRPFGAAATEGMASDSTSCRGNYPVPSGFADSTCTIEQ
ncbi:MAG TPA: hypothetical protein VF483_04095 [Gemmatimonadaceae bacterium]